MCVTRCLKFRILYSYQENSKLNYITIVFGGFEREENGFSVHLSFSVTSFENEVPRCPLVAVKLRVFSVGSTVPVTAHLFWCNKTKKPDVLWVCILHLSLFLLALPFVELTLSYRLPCLQCPWWAKPGCPKVPISSAE